MGRKRLHEVSLKEGEREELESFIRKGKASARSLTRARILLLADEGRSDKEIVDVLKVCRGTVRNTRDKYWKGGLDCALNEKPRSGAPPKIDGRVEAELTLLACSDPPEGRSRWTIMLLRDKLVEMGVVDSISHMTVYRTLKKKRSSRGSRRGGV